MASPQTRNCILLRSADVEIWQTLWTDVDQTFTIRTPLLTGCNAGCMRGNGIVLLAWPPKKLSPAAAVIVVGLTGRMLSRQSTDQTMPVLVCWKAWRRPVADWAFQMTVPEIIIAGPHCLCVRSILASNTSMLRHDVRAT